MQRKLTRSPPSRGRRTSRTPSGKPWPVPRNGWTTATPLSTTYELSVALLRRLSDDPSVAGILECHESFEWVDGIDGREHLHVPLALVRRQNGRATFVDVATRAGLLRNAELGDRRRRIELECAARGAGYEIWTEGEILEDPTVIQMVRVAAEDERCAYDGSRPDPSCHPGIVTSLAVRLLLETPRPVGLGWVARSRLTGIHMSLLLDLRVDPETRLVSWQPRRPKDQAARSAPPAPSQAAERSEGIVL